ELGADKITGIVMSAKPLNRAHERLIRLVLDKSDLVILFLQKPYVKEESLPFEVRLEALNLLVDNYLPKKRVLVVPLEKTYIFAGINELILDALLLQNFGCTKFVIGREHTGLGMYYEHQQTKSIFDTLKGLSISIEISSNFVYCDSCKTLVSTQTCPHGQHHHISYHSSSILELLEAGLLPPPMLVRKEIAAIYLSYLFPRRFKNLEKIYADMIPGTGLIEAHNERDFYIELAKLYQTTSLT
ncbi:MAG: sulfate adenylyltransferase, partial [Campylobacterales bacterium]